MGEHPAWGVAVLRVALGGIFVAHGWYEWATLGPQGLADLMIRIGNPPGLAGLLAWYTILAHVVGGLLLVVGFLTPWAALGQLPIMAAALFLVHWSQGFYLHGVVVDAAAARAVVAGSEYALLVFAGTVTLVLTGSGALSIDRARGHKTSMRRKVL